MKNLVYNSDFGAVVYPKSTGETLLIIVHQIVYVHLALCFKIVIIIIMHRFHLLDDIKKALAFANEHAIRPTVYSSGHDFIGKIVFIFASIQRSRM